MESAEQMGDLDPDLSGRLSAQILEKVFVFVQQRKQL